MFERLTKDAREALSRARHEAERLGHGSIGTEHILLGLVDDPESPAALVLRVNGLDAARVRAEVEKLASGTGAPSKAAQGALPFTPGAKKVLELCLDSAQRLGSDVLDGRILLLALAREQDGVAARVLRGLDLTPESIEPAAREWKTPRSLMSLGDSKALLYVAFLLLGAMLVLTVLSLV